MKTPDVEAQQKSEESSDFLSLPLPTRTRAMLCTKCGYNNRDTQAPIPYADCENPRCGYSALVYELDFSEHQLIAYTKADRAQRSAEAKELAADLAGLTDLHPHAAERVQRTIDFLQKGVL